MRIILIILTFFILNLAISCGEDTKTIEEEKNLCENITCGDFSECKVVEDASLDSKSMAICNCNENYHEENKVCVENDLTKESFIFTCTKMIECNFGKEENLELCTIKYNSYYHSQDGGINAYYIPVGNYIKDYKECVESKTECSEYSTCYDKLMSLLVKEDTPCDSTTYVNHCNDKGSLEYCYNGVVQEYYCPFYDKVCLEEPSANCYLKDNTPSCENNLETTCENGDMVLCRDNKELRTSCVEHYGEGFTCMSFSYPSGDFTKNTYGCFYE